MATLNDPKSAEAGAAPGVAPELVARLLERIHARTAVVAVIGTGYVGLPLAVAFADAGLRVIGIDVDAARVASLRAGDSPVADVPSSVVAGLARPVSQLLDRTEPRGGLAFTTDVSVISQVDAAVICVPTPLGSSREPDVSYVRAAGEAIAAAMRPGLLVVLESTSYPGTTEEVLLPLLEHPGRPTGRDGDRPDERWVAGYDFFLAFSPERIDPGRTDYTVRTTPKVVGGITPACLEVAIALYGTAVDRVVPVSGARTAEMVKLYENSFRLVNIGLANELALMCERLDVDVWEVVDAAATKPFGFMPFYPGPGLGGHCIPIDPLYLAWKMHALGFEAHAIQVAAEMTEAMPLHVVDRVLDALNDERLALRGSTVLVIGVAYKPDVDDPRESPAIEVIRLLLEKGAEVRYHDDHVPVLRVGATELRSVPLTADTVASAACVVITTPHSSIDWGLVAQEAKVVVDTRNALHRAGLRGKKEVML